MEHRKTKLSDGPSKRTIYAMLRQPSVESEATFAAEAVSLCDGKVELARDVFMSGLAVKWQADQRADLAELSPEDYGDGAGPGVAKIQAHAEKAWVFTGRGARKPKAPTEVVLAKKKSYTFEEMQAALAQANAKIAEKPAE